MAALVQYGHGCLPLVLLNGAIVSRGRYPSRKKLAQLAGVKRVVWTCRRS